MPKVPGVTEGKVIRNGTPLATVSPPVTDVRMSQRNQNRLPGLHRRSILPGFLSLLMLVGSPLRAGETVALAAAADLTYCLNELNQAFQAQDPGVEVKVSTGSSGNFSAQIQNGAPFDLFLSADVRYPQELIKAGKAVRESLFIYAAGRLVLWTADPQRVDVGHGLEVLRNADTIHKIAIANPEHAPYGRAAQAALQAAQLWSQVQNRLVIGENIAQAAQYVETHNADAGLIALALVLSPRLEHVGQYVEVDPRLYPRLDQAAVLTSKGAENPAAKAYLTFLRSADARRVLDKFGFGLPTATESNP
jgi:molybdate transport system substrate-binding protein